MNQAIFAWSFRQINAEQGTYLNVKSKIDSLDKKTFLKIEQGIDKYYTLITCIKNRLSEQENVFKIEQGIA